MDNSAQDSVSCWHQRDRETISGVNDRVQYFDLNQCALDPLENHLLARPSVTKTKTIAKVMTMKLRKLESTCTLAWGFKDLGWGSLFWTT